MTTLHLYHPRPAHVITPLTWTGERQHPMMYWKDAQPERGNTALASAATSGMRQDTYQLCWCSSWAQAFSWEARQAGTLFSCAWGGSGAIVLPKASFSMAAPARTRAHSAWSAVCPCRRDCEG